MNEEPEQITQDDQSQKPADEEPVVDGRESANEVTKELKEQEKRIEEGG